MSMSEEDLRKLARDAVADQSAEAIGRMGLMTCTLYESISRGAPPKLAATLTRDWFYLQLCKVLWPNDPAQPPLWDMSNND